MSINVDEIIIMDFETASLNVEDGPVEIAWLSVTDELKVLDEVQSLIKPYGPISASAAGVHGITEDMVENSPTLEEFMQSKGNPFANKVVLFSGHNCKFDLKYAQPYIGQAYTLDTLKLARIHFPEAENHKLQTLMFHLKLQKKGRHNALDDCYTCLELLQKIMGVSGLNLEQLYEQANAPLLLEKMPFGKHKGMPIKDLPRQYVSWARRELKLDEDLAYTLNKYFPR